MLSRRAVLLTFMIGGPMLWLPVCLVVGGLGGQVQLTSLMFSPAMGGFIWYLAALTPSNWLYTWIPTLGSALLYSGSTRRLQHAVVPIAKRRWRLIALHCALAAVISASVFSICMLVEACLGLRAPLFSGKTPRDPLAAQALALPAPLLIGTVAIIGAVLGTALAAFRATVRASPADSSRAAYSPPPEASSRPSLRLVLGTFLIGGPLLYMPLISILVHDFMGATTSAQRLGSVIALPLLAPIGAIAWYGSLLYPRMWLYTWIPTVSAALLFWVVFKQLPMQQCMPNRQATYRCGLVYATLGSALSLIFFALCQLLSAIFGHGAPPVSDHAAFAEVVRSAAGRTVLLAVAILGALLGGAVYVIETWNSRRT
jgi:hypothetical protein